MRRVPGFIGADLSQRVLNDKIEYLVLTKRHSMDVICGFAPDFGKAVVKPGAVAALVDFDDRVNHYKVVETSRDTSCCRSARQSR